MDQNEDQELIDYLLSHGYSNIRRLKSGELAGISKMIFTTGLFVGLNEVSYRTRFCYHDWEEAAQALEEWDGFNDPPGMWIKEKGRNERHGPGSREWKKT